MASYPAVIELRVDGITQVTRVLDTIEKLDRALVSIKKTPLAIDSGKATDGIRVLKEEVDRFVIGLGNGTKQLAATTAGLNSQAAAFRNLAANAKIGGEAFKLYTQAAEQARQKTSLVGGLAEIKAQADLYKVGRTAGMQSFKGVEELIKFGAQIPKNTASLELYKLELQRVLTVVDYGTKDYYELAKAIADVNKQLAVGQGMGPQLGPALPPGARRKGAGRGTGGGGGGVAGAISSAAIGGAFPLLFGQSGGAAVGGAVGGLAGSLLGPGGGFAGSLVGTLLGELASKGDKVKQLGEDIGFSTEQTKLLAEAVKLAGTDFEKLEAAVRNIGGLGLSIEDQADAIQLSANLADKYGGKIDKIAAAYADFVGKGKVAFTDISKIADQNIPIFDKLEKKFNTNRAGILALAKDGKISAQVLSDALVEIANSADTAAEQTSKGWDSAWKDLQRGAALSLQATTAVFNALTGAGLESSGNIAADFASMYAFLVEGAINMGVRVSSVFANIARSAANLAATFDAYSGKLNPFAKGAVAGFKAVEGTFSRLNIGLQNIDTAGFQQSDVGRITVPGAAPPSGGGGRKKGGKSDAERELELRRKQLEAADDLNFSLKNKLAILQETDELIKKEVELDVQLNEITREYSELRKNAKSQDELILINANEILEKKYAELEAERAINQILEDRARLRIELGREAIQPTVFDPVEAQKAAIDSLVEKYAVLGSVADSTAGLITFGFDEIVNGTKSVEQVFADFLRNIANALLQAAQQMIAQYILIGIARRFAFGGGFDFTPVNSLPSVGAFNPLPTNFGGGLATGGPTSPNTAYIVGERGPELFIPNRSGTVISNDNLGSMGTTNVVVNVDAKGSSVQGDDARASQLGRVVSAAVQAELIKQQRPGGLLANTR